MQSAPRVRSTRGPIATSECDQIAATLHSSTAVNGTQAFTRVAMLWRIVKTRQVAGTIASMVPAYVDCWTQLRARIRIVNVIYCDRARSVRETTRPAFRVRS
jgi:hypothetical protein